MDPTQVKNNLRAKIRTERRGLSQAVTDKWNQQILENLKKTIDFKKVKNLHCYLAVKDWREVDTWPLVKYLWQNHPQIVVAAPKIVKDKTMESIILTPKTKLIKNSIGITEPEGTSLPADTKFDLIIVPTLAFDNSGYRLGSGSGHYDKFLERQHSAKLVGLCYEQGRLDKSFPHEAHDIKLSTVVTEATVTNF